MRILQEAGWASGLVRTDDENLVPTRFWTLYHLALKEPFYCLCYPDCLIDDRLKYNILSLTVLLWNMTPSRESCRRTWTVPLGTSYLIIQCHNPEDHSWNRQTVVSRVEDFISEEWTVNWGSMYMRVWVFVINWDQLKCHEHKNPFFNVKCIFTCTHKLWAPGHSGRKILHGGT